MGQEIYFLDLLGTFSFAVYGTYYALKKDFDLFGIFVAAFLSALGGGTIREIILKNIPFYFFDNNYIISVILGIAFTILIYKHFHKIKMFALFLDSIGLVTFAFVGASKANEMGLGLFPIILLATVTAVGGGAMRDIVLNKISKIMYYDFYATIAIMLGFIYGIFKNQMQNFLYANLLIVSFLIIRIVVIIYKINLWKPKK